jgi:hypothetical protein
MKSKDLMFAVANAMTILQAMQPRLAAQEPPSRLIWAAGPWQE